MYESAVKTNIIDTWSEEGKEDYIYFVEMTPSYFGDEEKDDTQYAGLITELSVIMGLMRFDGVSWTKDPLTTVIWSHKFDAVNFDLFQQKVNLNTASISQLTMLGMSSDHIAFFSAVMYSGGSFKNLDDLNKELDAAQQGKGKYKKKVVITKLAPERFNELKNFIESRVNENIIEITKK